MSRSRSCIASSRRTPNLVERFRREGVVLRKLLNPHAVATYELGETPRPAVHRDGAARRRDAARHVPRARLAAVAARCSGSRKRGVQRARRSARARHRPSRSQAREHLPHPERRREGPRLRDREDHVEQRGRRSEGADHHGHGGRHARVHGARAADGWPRRWPHRHLHARRRDVRDDHRTASIQFGRARSTDRTAEQRAAAAVDASSLSRPRSTRCS